jgi:hypothetical protein
MLYVISCSWGFPLYLPVLSCAPGLPWYLFLNLLLSFWPTQSLIRTSPSVIFLKPRIIPLVPLAMEQGLNSTLLAYFHVSSSLNNPPFLQSSHSMFLQYWNSERLSTLKFFLFQDPYKYFSLCLKISSSICLFYTYFMSLPVGLPNCHIGVPKCLQGGKTKSTIGFPACVSLGENQRDMGQMLGFLVSFVSRWRWVTTGSCDEGHASPRCIYMRQEGKGRAPEPGQNPVWFLWTPRVLRGWKRGLLLEI